MTFLFKAQILQKQDCFIVTKQKKHTLEPQNCLRKVVTGFEVYFGLHCFMTQHNKDFIDFCSIKSRAVFNILSAAP